MEKIFVPKSPREKAMQRALIQYRKPQNYNLVAEALKLAGREDLIGFDKKCLIRGNSKDRPDSKGNKGRQDFKGKKGKNTGRKKSKKA